MATDDNKEINCKSILIIDDDKIFCNLLKTLLNKIIFGITVGIYDVLSNGEPDENFDWSAYDLIIMDYNLGGGQNGIDWLRKYKNRSGFPPAIILTAQGSEDLVVEVMQAGARDYINKQKLSLERLASAIRKAVNDQSVKQEIPAVASNEVIPGSTSSQSAIISKVDFYKRIDDLLKAGNEGNQPFLFQMEINDYQKIQDSDGLLCADEYITRVTGLLAGFLQQKHFQFNLALTGDSKIVGCITEYNNDAGDVDKIVGSLCEDLSYSVEIGDRTVESTITVGGVMMEGNEKLDALFDQVESVCEKISDRNKNSYHILNNPVAMGTREETSNEPEQEVRKEGSEENLGMEGPGIDIAEIIKNKRLQTRYQSFIPLSEHALNLGYNYSQVQVHIQNEKGHSYSLEDLRVMDQKDKHRVNLDLWIIGQALGEIIKLKSQNKELKLGLFIGLSREALTSSLLVQWLKELIKKSDIKMIKSILIFEIQSSDFIETKDKLIKLMEYLRNKIDVKFSVYDIGDESVLKTCMEDGQFEFVRITLDEGKIEEIRKLSILVNELGASCIMENVHEAEHLNLAIDLDADYCQGNFVQPATEEIIISDDELTE